MTDNNSFNLRELAVDLGTANTRVMYHDEIVLEESSAIMIDSESGRLLLLGNEAAGCPDDGMGKNHVVWPLANGVISDFQAFRQMVVDFLRIVNGRSPIPLKVAAVVPTGLTEVEERFVCDVLKKSGAVDVRLIYGPFAAAIGIGLDVMGPEAKMIVDIGGGTSEISVISSGSIVQMAAIKTAGDEFTRDIVDYIQQIPDMENSSRMAEQVKIHVGAAMRDVPDAPAPFELSNYNLENPKTIRVTHDEVADVLDNSIGRIETAVMNVLNSTTPKMLEDISRLGIHLVGGGALLRCLDRRLHLKTGFPVHVAEDPLRAVVRGTSVALRNFDRFPFFVK